MKEWSNWHTVARCQETRIVEARKAWMAEVRVEAADAKCAEFSH